MIIIDCHAARVTLREVAGSSIYNYSKVDSATSFHFAQNDNGGMA